MSENEKIDVRPAEDEIDILDLLIVLARRKKAILGFTFGAAALSIAISLFMTDIYTGKTTLLPPQQGQSTASAMLGQLGALAGMAGGAIGIKSPNDLYIGMLKSDTVENDLVQRFGLMKIYHSKKMTDARKSLEGNSRIASGKDGIISIEFDDRDPKRAADMANAYVEELNRLTSTLAVTEASQRRLFFEKQLDQVKENLSKAEYGLQKIQGRDGMIQVYPQEKEIAESNARLRAEIAAREVELSAMRTGVTERNPEYVRIQGEIAGLRHQLDGKEDSGDGADRKVSGSSLEYLEKFRDVKFEQAVMELLYKQFEAAKIDEAKDYPLIQVLDKASPPERKSKPKRAIIVILSTLVAFFVSIFYAFVKEALEKAKSDPEQSEKLGILKNYIKVKKSTS